MSPSQALITAVMATLPDLIDKPLGLMGFGPHGTRRLIGHTLFFSLAISLLAFWALPVLWPWVLAAPIHLLLDEIWVYPKTMLWPLRGWNWDISPLPEEIKAAGYLAGVRWRWEHDPSIKMEAGMEALGLVLIGWVGYRLL